VYIELGEDEVAVAMRVGHFRHVCMAYRMWADDVSDPDEKKKWLNIAECVEDQIAKSLYKSAQEHD